MRNQIKTYVMNFVLVFVVPMLLVQILPLAVCLLLSVLTGQDSMDSYFLLSIIVSSLAAVLYSLFFIRQTNTGGFSFQVPKVHVIVMVMCILLVFLFADQILSAWILNHLSDPGMIQRAETVGDIGTGWNLWMYVTYALLIAPISEEFVFRIALYPYLKKSMHWIPAMFLTSLSFGAIHMTVTHLVTATLFGIVLVLVMERTQCIWITIAGHVFYNMSVLFVDRDLVSSLSENDTVVFLTAFATLAVLAGYVAKRETLRELKQH